MSTSKSKLSKYERKIYERRSQEIQSRARKAGCGYTTRKAITWWKNEMQTQTSEVNNLVANPDENSPLFFWQLYSLLGEQRVLKIVSNFYDRVYKDTQEPWFKDAFVQLSSKSHHITTQAAFWLDAFGAGKQYHGDEARLNFHHTNNASHVMTYEGAVRWMYHMRNALDRSDLTEDPRVRPCIDVFLYVMMEKYARQFGFQTDQRVYGPDFTPPAHKHPLFQEKKQPEGKGDVCPLGKAEEEDTNTETESAVLAPELTLEELAEQLTHKMTEHSELVRSIEQAELASALAEAEQLALTEDVRDESDQDIYR